jgi:molybdate transport system substrate-binding protein
MRILLRFCLLVGLSLAASSGALAQDVRVSAAASMSNVVDELAKVWKADGGGTVVASYGASSALARQIENGAPADVFISADLEWMDYVQNKKLVDPATRRIVAANSLVLIAPAGSKIAIKVAPGMDLAAALGDGRLALADPNSVPAGKYAKAALVKLGVWRSVEAKLASAENVRGALALVARGEAPLGAVYSTDAAAEPKIRIVATFPGDSHPAIVYAAAITVTGKDNAKAKAFLDFLGSAKALAIFAKYGFAPPPM